jgi:hypothetical protein
MPSWPPFDQVDANDFPTFRDSAVRKAAEFVGVPNGDLDSCDSTSKAPHDIPVQATNSVRAAVKLQKPP